MRSNFFPVLIVAFLICAICGTGCGNLRYAPSEIQKGEAVVHNEVTQAIAARYAAEPTAEPNLLALMNLSHLQSQNILAYYGVPAQPVDPAFLAELKAAKPAAITAAAELSKQAAADAAKRPANWWNVFDGLLGLVLAVATILGGAGGIKIISWITLLLNKSKALREVVEGNEALKSQTPVESNELFKSIQKLVQSDSTVKIVDAIRKELAIRDAAKN